jgi:hypothetical protein
MSRSPGSTLLGISAVVVTIAGLAFLAFAGTRLLLREGYPQDTPEAVLTSARRMVENGHASRLPDLIYAESKPMRDLLNELGAVLGSLQALAREVQRHYPEEIDALRKEADAAAKNGQATSFLQKMVGQVAPGGRRNQRGRGPQLDLDASQQRRTFDNAMKEVFADPYGWLARSEGRLTVQTLTSDTAALMWDGKPVFGVGLLLKEDRGKWYLMLPTNLPGMGRILPKSDETWQIMGNLLDVLDNMVKDLTQDVRRGKIKRLDDLAHSAGEKAFIPAAIVLFAYGKAMDEERKAQRAAGQAPAKP